MIFEEEEKKANQDKGKILLMSKPLREELPQQKEQRNKIVMLEGESMFSQDHSQRNQRDHKRREASQTDKLGG